MADRTDSAELPPARAARRRWLSAAVWVCRGLVALFLANAVLNLAASLPGGTTVAGLSNGLIHADLHRVFLTPAAPAAAREALRSWTPAALTALVVGWGLVTTGVLLLRLAAIAGLLLAAALLALTLRSTGADLWSDVAAANPWLLCLGVALYGIVIGITVVRWRMLLAVQGIHVPLRSLARLSLIGVFFNLAIPGAVSGDLVKMGYLAAWSGERKAEGVLTIMVDRIVGVLGLFVVAAVSTLCAIPLLVRLGEGYRPLQMAAVTVGLGSVGGVVGVLLVECRAALVRHPWIKRLVEVGARILPAKLTALLIRLTAALELFRNTRLTMLKALLLAVAVHALLAVNLFTLGRAVGERGLGLRHYVITASVANSVASIPVTPGGVGTRDKTAAAFLSAFDAQPQAKAGSIPVVQSLVIVFWALVGAGAFATASRCAGRQASARAPSVHTQTPAG